MNTPMTAASNLAHITPEVWSANYYGALLAKLPFNAIIATDWQGEISKLGDTVNISQFPEFGDAEEIAEDGVANSDSLTVSNLQLVINKRITKDFTVTDLAVLQSLPFMDKLRDMATYAILKKVQRNIIDISVPSASAPDHAIAYDSSTTLALADMLEIKDLLDLQDVPEEDRHCVLGSAQGNDIFNITGFTSSDFLMEGSPLSSGKIPAALLGFNPHMTTEVGNTSYWFHRSYATMAMQKDLSVKEFDLGVIGKRQVRVNLDVLGGFKLLDSTRLATLS